MMLNPSMQDNHSYFSQTNFFIVNKFGKESLHHPKSPSPHAVSLFIYLVVKKEKTLSKWNINMHHFLPLGYLQMKEVVIQLLQHLPHLNLTCLVRNKSQIPPKYKHKIGGGPSLWSQIIVLQHAITSWSFTHGFPYSVFMDHWLSHKRKRNSILLNTFSDV